MNKKILLTLSVLVLFGAGCNKVVAPKAKTVTINNHAVTVEVANTESLRNKGLSGHDSLAENAGMLFVFDAEGAYKFWMKDMKFALDFVWIKSDGTIADITQNVDPSTYPQPFSPQAPVLYVLEVRSGWVAKNQVKVGDKAIFDID